MKPTLCIITETTWWDTDSTILPNLIDKFELDIHIIANKDKNRYSEEEIGLKQRELGIKLTIWKRVGRIRNPMNFLLYLKMYKVIKKNNPQNTWINYIYMYDPYINFLIILISRYRKFISIHDYSDHIGMKNVVRDLLKKLIYKRNKIFHFYSESESKKFKKDHPEKQVFFTEMPIKDFGPPSSFNDVRDKGEKVTFLFFGSIRFYKGLDLLLSAIKKLENSNYRLLIAGKADNWDEYAALVADNPNILSEITLIDNQDIPKYFSNTDYLILPYRATTQSGPALVAFNYNVPIIASDLPAFKNAVNDGVDGFLFEKENVNSLLNALNNALNMSTAEYQKMKHAQYLKVLGYKDMEKQIGSVYYENLENTTVVK